MENAIEAQRSDDWIEQNHRVFRKGSLTFSLAARLFPEDLHTAASMLYRWCRHCDDEIDGAASGRVALAELERDTRAAYDSLAHEPAFRGLGTVARRFSIPLQYPLDLLEGMRMDVENAPYETLEDLRRYCYCVAGTVGLMMTYIVGASSSRALPHAIEMGIAMQLTNIARDVKEDLAMGRVYLPSAWLNEAGAEMQLEDEADRARLHAVVVRLLKAAEESYDFALDGLRYLPLRGVFAIAAASSIYREIGRRILRNGPDALLTRTVVPLPRKLVCLAGSLIKCMPIAVSRIARSWKRATLPDSWRFS